MPPSPDKATATAACSGEPDARSPRAAAPATGSPYDVAGDLANCTAHQLRQRLALEMDRRRVLERIAANDLLTHVLESVAGMIERQTSHPVDSCNSGTTPAPGLRAMVVVHAGSGGDESLGASPSSRGAAPSLGDAALEAAHQLDLAAVLRDGRSALPAAPLAVPVRVTNLETDPAWQPLRQALAGQSVRAVWSLDVPIGDTAPLAMLLVFCPTLRRPNAAEAALMELGGGLIATALEHQAELDRLALQALHDPLTGLANRALLQDRLTQSIAISRRQGVPVSTYLIELEGFRALNDTLGTAAGDELLRQVAARLRGGVRQSDTVARTGADEFMVVAGGVHTRRDAAALGQKLLALLRCPYRVGPRELFVGAAIGVSMFPQDGDDAAAIQGCTAAALRRAREAGANNIAFYAAEQRDPAGMQKLELEGALREVLADPRRTGLELHYQPQVDFAGRIIGLEALLRWKHPQLGMISPGMFIPMAEETGLILSLGDWALRDACGQARAWWAAGLFGSREAASDADDRDGFRVAVNVSALQFARANFVDTVLSVLADTGLEPRWLELELTESVLMHNTREAAEKIARLRDAGVAVAIDDFGTGYSSLAYLHRLPIDTLKIDRSFVSGVTVPAATGPTPARPHPSAMPASSQRPDAAIPTGGEAVIRAIISMGQSLRLRVLAEGVETPEQRRFLVDNGCHLMQGYLFSRPLPANTIASLLQSTGRLGPAALAMTA